MCDFVLYNIPLLRIKLHNYHVTNLIEAFHYIIVYILSF